MLHTCVKYYKINYQQEIVGGYFLLFFCNLLFLMLTSTLQLPCNSMGKIEIHSTQYTIIKSSVKNTTADTIYGAVIFCYILL